MRAGYAHDVRLHVRESRQAREVREAGHVRVAKSAIETAAFLGV